MFRAAIAAWGLSLAASAAADEPRPVRVWDAGDTLSRSAWRYAPSATTSHLIRFELSRGGELAFREEAKVTVRTTSNADSFQVELAAAWSSGALELRGRLSPTGAVLVPWSLQGATGSDAGPFVEALLALPEWIVSWPSVPVGLGAEWDGGAGEVSERWWLPIDGPVGSCRRRGYARTQLRVEPGRWLPTGLVERVGEGPSGERWVARVTLEPL